MSYEILLLLFKHLQICSPKHFETRKEAKLSEYEMTIEDVKDFMLQKHCLNFLLSNHNIFKCTHTRSTLVSGAYTV